MQGIDPDPALTILEDLTLMAAWLLILIALIAPVASFVGLLVGAGIIHALARLVFDKPGTYRYLLATMLPVVNRFWLLFFIGLAFAMWLSINTGLVIFISSIILLAMFAAYTAY